MLIQWKKKKRKKKTNFVCQDSCLECHFKSYFRAYVMICIILTQNETQIKNSMEWQNLLGKVKKIYITFAIVVDHFFIKG